MYVFIEGGILIFQWSFLNLNLKVSDFRFRCGVRSYSLMNQESYRTVIYFELAIITNIRVVLL